MPLTDKGYKPYTIAELRDILRTKYETETGESPNWLEDRFLGAFSEAVLSIAVLPGQLTQAIYDSISLTNAKGRLLENIADLFGLSRLDSTRSEAPVSVTGDPDTVIPVGKLVENTANGSRWVVTTDMVLSNPGGTATGTVEAETPGRIEGPSGSPIRIITPVSGWDTIAFTADADLGNDREEDGSLRARVRRRRAAGGAASVPAITTGLERLEFVNRASVVPNDTNSDIVVGAFTIPSRDVLLLLDTDLLTSDDEDALAERIFELLAASTNTVGSESVTTTFRGTTYTLNYANATEASVTVAATLVLDSGYDIADVSQEADLAIANYFETLTIGDDVTFLGVFRALGGVEGILSASFTLNAASSDVSIAQTEIALYDSTGSSYTV